MHWTANVVSTGPSPNFVAHATEHLTFNANGELTAVAIKFTGECR